MAEYGKNTSIETFKRELHRLRSNDIPNGDKIIYILNLQWKNEGAHVRQIESFRSLLAGYSRVTVNEGSSVLWFLHRHFTIYSQCYLDGVYYSIHSTKVAPMIHSALAAIQTYRKDK